LLISLSRCTLYKALDLNCAEEKSLDAQPILLKLKLIFKFNGVEYIWCIKHDLKVNLIGG